MPETPLTEILKDFRQYRPGNHREFLEAVRDCAQSSGVKAFALEDSVSAALYLQCLDQNRDFRWRHWCFTREYILKHTSHPTATGGSPIVTVSSHKNKAFMLKRQILTQFAQWLPNQLQAVMAEMAEAYNYCKSIQGTGDIMDLVNLQRDTLKKEVDKYCGERGVGIAAAS